VILRSALARSANPCRIRFSWLRTRPRIVAPIASARTTEQLDQILPTAKLELTPAEADRLTAASQPA